ncbi:MAG: hypothetical protein JNL67_10235 [Planctomycetaceae bacterium]|nr:hypothetical protein [Planctomycetaceae bacterium]
MNPLTWMRENQHKMLVFFTVMLMAGFGALSVMSTNVPQNAAPKDEIVPKPAVSWSKGTITDIELMEAWRRRLALTVYREKLLAAAQQIDPNYTPSENVMLGSAASEDVPAQARMVETFNVMLLAQKARDLGIQASDDTIDIILRRVYNVLSLNDMRAIATEVGREAGMMSYADFRELLKREFLAKQAFMLGIEAGLPQNVNPAAAFSYYCRINRKFDCQVLELKVDDYLSKVTETPSDSELKALFAEGQYRYPTFDGSKAGFKIGNRLKLQYFTADTSAVLNRLAAEIPLEEVRAEYDRLLAEKDPLVYTPPPTPLPSSDLDPANFLKNLGGDIPLNGPALTPPANSGDGTTPPVVPPTGSGDLDLPPPVPPTAEGETKQEAGGQGESQENSGKTGESGENAGGSGDEQGGSGDEQGGGDGGIREFVSLSIRPETQDATPPATQETPPVTQETTPATQETPPVTQETPPVQEAVPPVQETAPAQEQPPATAATTEQAPAEGSAPTQDPSTTQATPPPAEPKIRTFEETEQEIRRRLAGPKAMELVKVGFDDINKSLRVYRSDDRIHKANPETEPAAQPIDFAALAKKHQLIFGETPVVDQATLAKTNLGSIGGPENSFANQLFGSFDRLSQDPFAPLQVDGGTLVWITEAFPARAGDFDELKEQVVQYWKMQKARELALADAKAKAGEVKEGQKLKDVFSAAVDTGAFSWLTSDMFGQGLRISPVTGTDRVGEEFMETVSGLEVGKTTTAFNGDRSRVYVIYKTANAGQTDEELINQFLTSVGSFRDYPFQVRSVLQQREFQAGTKFVENVRDEYKVNFIE